MIPISRSVASLLLIVAANFGFAANYPTPTESDFTIRDFKFTSGETLPEIRIHTVAALWKDELVKLLKETKR